MDNTESMRKGIAALEKHTSLRQISLQSGINYITLRKIKNGETKNVSASVAERFEKFQKQFDPSKLKASASKPGPKPKAAGKAAPKKKAAAKAKAAAAAPAAAEAPAKKKPGPKPKAAAPAPEAAAKKKPGRPKKAAAKKKAGRPKRAAAPKPVAKPAAKPAADQAVNFGSPLLGEALMREIEIAEARIEYLKSLQMVEEEFLKAIGKK